MKMKKWIAMLLLAAVVLSLTACGEEPKETQAPESTLTGEEELKETLQVPVVTTEATGETTEATEETTEATEETTKASEEPSETTEEPTETELPVEIPTETETVTESASESTPGETFWAEENLEYPMSFCFSSGAGGWGTELYLNRDGSFTGTFHDSNMGENDESYPNGTVYICNFTGSFSPAERLDMYTYGVKLRELTLDRPEGEEWIRDGIRYISATPYGLEGGEDFLLYLPNTPVEMLSEEDLFWWPGRYYEDYTTLKGYGLYNLADGSGFFSMKEE